MESSSPFPSREARERERSRKRDALLLAAVQMFNERGYHATSLDDVASSLGVTKPVIYHHLGNKEQVLLACVRIGLDQLSQGIEEASKVEGSGLDRLLVALRRYAQMNMEPFARCVIRTDDSIMSEDNRREFRQVKREIDDQIRAMIQAAVDDGSAQVPDVRFAAFAITGALNWPARWHRDNGELASSDVAERLVSFLVSGLRPR